MRFLAIILAFLIIFLGGEGAILSQPQPDPAIQNLVKLKEYMGNYLWVDADACHIYVEFVNYHSFWQSIKHLDPWLISPKRKLVIHLFSHGGSLFDALAIGSLISEVSAQRPVEIRARGLVASAGLIVLVSGSQGHRFICRDSMIMFHELNVFEYLSFKSVTDKEEEARVLRMIQDRINGYIISRSRITKQQLENKIKKKEFWMTADEAIQYGFADKFI